MSHFWRGAGGRGERGRGSGEGDGRRQGNEAIWLTGGVGRMGGCDSGGDGRCGREMARDSFEWVKCSDCASGKLPER